MRCTPTTGSSNSPAQLDFRRAEGLLPAEEEPTPTLVALIAGGPTQTIGLSSGGSDGPDRVGNVSCDSPREYRLRSCGIAREATQPAAAAACVGREAPASTLAVSRNRELTGQGAVGEQLGESRAWSSRVHRGDRTGESHSMSEDATCLRRLVQKVGEARRFFWYTVAMTSWTALRWGQEAAAKEGGSEGETPGRVQGRGSTA